MFKILRTFLVLLSIVGCSAASADLAIIVHPDYQGGELDEESVKKLFLGESKNHPSGHKALLANHVEGSPDRKNFFEYVLVMKDKKYKRIWSRRMSAGKKSAPTELGSHEDVLAWIKEQPLGITYIDKTKVDNSVKVLFTVLVFEDL